MRGLSCIPVSSEAKSLSKKPLVGKDSWRSGLQGSVAPSVSGSEAPKVLIINTHVQPRGTSERPEPRGKCRA